MTFARLRRADWAAMLAALALLFAMATDWYSTEQGDAARRIEQNTRQPSSGQQGEIDRAVNEDARTVAQREEKNAWQAGAGIDRLILIVLLGAAGLALVAGFLRAGGRRFDPPLTPSGAAAIASLIGALLVTYRIIQEPGLDAGSTIKPGAPLAVGALGLLALVTALALRNEEAGEPFRELPKPADPAKPPEKPEPAAS
jgi:hypothetical protein